MEKPFKTSQIPENIVNMAKSKKTEKPQAELRKSLEERLLEMRGIIKSVMEEYKQALEEESFEDKQGEEEVSGEKIREKMQFKINVLLDKAEQMKTKLDSKEKLPNYTESISTSYTHPDSKVENITFSLEEKLEENIAIYKKTKLDLPPDFEDQIKEIWENNIDEIQKAIQEKGFDEMLLVPGNIPLTELNTKMTDVYTETWEDSDFKSGDSFKGAKSQNVDKPRMVLAHKIQNLKDRPELKKTLDIKGKDVKMDQTLTLEDYLIFQRKFFEETGQHLDTDGWTWLATKSGSRLVNATWDPDDGQVLVDADDLDSQYDYLGARPSRSFF